MISLLMRRLAWLPLHRPRTVLWLSLFVTIVSLFFIPRLHVSTDRNLLAGKKSPEFQRREEVSRLFGTSLVSVAVIEAKTQDGANRAADDLALRLQKNSTHIRQVFYKADVAFFERKALLFASTKDVDDFVTALNSNENLVMRLGNVHTVAGLIGAASAYVENYSDISSTPGTPRQIEKGMVEIERFLLDVENWFRNPHVEELSAFTELEKKLAEHLSIPLMNDGTGYFSATDGKAPFLAVLFIQPQSDSQAMETVAPLTDLIRHHARLVGDSHGVKVFVTGMPSLATDELRLVSRDCLVAGVVAGLGVLLVFMVAFRSIRVSIFLVLPLGVGLIWAAGFTGWMYAHLTMITSYFAAVLFGLGVAFTIHIVARFHEALLTGESKPDALETALVCAGPGVLVGGLTTAFAFLAIVFSEFKGFAEMGVISGVGVLLILLANLTLLPAALLLWHPGKSAVYSHTARTSTFGWHRIRLLIPLLGLVLFTVGVVVAPKVSFNYAVESMLPSSSEAVQGIDRLNRRTPFSSTFSISTVDSIKDAVRLTNKYKSLSTVSRVESVALVLPTEQKQKVKSLSRLASPIRNVLLESPRKWKQQTRKTDSKQALEASFRDLQYILTDVAFDAKRAQRSEAKMLDRLAIASARVARAIGESSTQRAVQFNAYILKHIEQGLRILDGGFVATEFGVEELPDTIRGRFVSADGKQFAVIIYPAGDIGRRSFFFRHVDELLSVDSAVTGHPITHRRFTEMVQRGFVQAVGLSAAAVVLLVLLDLRSRRGVLLALGPVVLAAGWTALLMYLTGFQLNYANLMALPILIGTGVDYGVHLAHRAEQENDISTALQTTGKAIVLSGVTTLIGFGSLIVGNHWGVKSLGILLVTGISFALLGALAVMPAFFWARGGKRSHGRR